MRPAHVLLAASLATAACGAESVDQVAQCEQVQTEWNALMIEIGRACEDDGDCVVLGGRGGTCDNVRPVLEGCEGSAVNAEAAAARQAEIEALQARWTCGSSEFCEAFQSCDLDCNSGAVDCRDGSCVPYSTCLSGCNPVAQTSCGSDDKCTWIQIDSANQIGTQDCAPEGGMDVGDACTYGPDGETTGYDDCVAGAICVDGACREICTTSPDSCDAPSTCVTRAGLFPETSSYGACFGPA